MAQSSRSQRLISLGLAGCGLSVTQHIQLEPSHCVGRHHVSLRVAEMERVERALHDARATLHALPRPRHGGHALTAIYLKYVSGTHLLTEAGSLTAFPI